MATISITGDQGWTQYAPGSPKSADVIDCTGASWNTNNSGSPQLEYPVYINNWTVPVQVKGGTINGSFSLTLGWGTIYSQGNSAAVFIKLGQDGSSVTGWRMSQVFDGVRITGVDNFLIEDVRIDITRDDAVEVDNGYNGIIRDCLFENCFVGVSFGDANTPSSALGNVLQIDNTLIHMGADYLYQDTPDTHGTPLKCGANSPSLLLTDTVIAITRADHDVLGRLETSFSKVLPASTGNYYLNLTDDPLPSNYPTIPGEFTYLEGQAARDYWKSARAAFVGGNPSPPVNPPTPAPAALPEIRHLLEINPTSGAIRTQTPEAYVVEVTVGGMNASGRDTKTVTVTVA